MFENNWIIEGRNLFGKEDNIYKNRYDEERMTKYIEKQTIREIKSAGD